MHALNPIAMPRPRRRVPAAAVVWFSPLQQLGRAVEHLLDRRVAPSACRSPAAGLRARIPAPELDRIDAELARDHVGVALVGPDELRDAEARSAPAGGRLVYIA